MNPEDIIKRTLPAGIPAGTYGKSDTELAAEAIEEDKGPIRATPNENATMGVAQPTGLEAENKRLREGLRKIAMPHQHDLHSKIDCMEVALDTLDPPT